MPPIGAGQGNSARLFDVKARQAKARLAVANVEPLDPILTRIAVDDWQTFVRLAVARAKRIAHTVEHAS